VGGFGEEDFVFQNGGRKGKKIGSLVSGIYSLRTDTGEKKGGRWKETGMNPLEGNTIIVKDEKRM